MFTFNQKRLFDPAKILASLMLLQMILGIILNFIFLKPILSFNGTASTDELTFILGFATLTALVISSMNLSFGLLLPKDKTNQHNRLFITLIVFASIGITLCAYEYAQLTEYVSFMFHHYMTDAGSNSLAVDYMKKSLATGRNEAHYFSIFISSCSLFFFYLLMLRAAMIPKLLASFACLSVALQLIAVGHTFFESSIPNLLQLPLAITQLVVPVYLFIRGFKHKKTINEPALQLS